jgi:diguanylate cyclase (GGDEF)-like protein
LLVVVISLTITGLFLLKGIEQNALLESRETVTLLGRTLAGSFTAPLARGEHEILQRQIDQMAELKDQFPDVIRVVVADEAGRVVAHSDPTRFGRPWGRIPPAQEEVTIDDSVTPPQVTLLRPIASAVRFGSLELVVSARGPWLVAQRAAHVAVIGLVITSVALVLLLSLLLNRLLVRPIERLADAANAFRAEQRTISVLPEGPDELRTLAGAFNGMAQRLNEHAVGLEQKVEERTQELRSANEQLQSANQALRAANLQLQEMAVTDHLTGVSNRRAFTERIGTEIERARRSRQPLAMVMFDIDRFKVLNDTLGHLEGDRALVMLAGLLAHNRRASDMVARFGGEEFALLLPGAGFDDAMMVAEKIRAATESARMPGSCTVSAGVATFPDHALDARTLIAAADAAMYEAKALGRNRVAGARPVSPFGDARTMA